MSETIEMKEGNAQTALLTALQNEDLDEFTRIFYHNFGNLHININHLYEDAENKTLLDIACSSPNKAAYVDFLLQFGADVNLFNNSHGMAPIHFALSNLDNETVKLLVSETDINIHQPDASDVRKTKRQVLKSGDEWFERLLPLLQDRTAYAGKQGIALPILEPESSIQASLFLLINQRDYEAFNSKVNEDNVNLTNNASRTYLQVACANGFIEFVELLLNLNVDPNQNTRQTDIFPIELAAFYGYHNIVQLLLETGIIKVKSQILLYITEGYYLMGRRKENIEREMSLRGIIGHNFRDMDHIKCLKLILDNVPDSQLNVNCTNENGDTPLHNAISSDNRDMILSLLERGAYIGATNNDGKVAIQLMMPSTLEYFLKGCFSTNTNFIADDVHEKSDRVVFNYNFLVREERNYNETKPLVALGEIPELRPFLRHPLLLVFLDFKWQFIMKKLFHVYVAFQVWFVSFLSIYLLTRHDNTGSPHNIIIWYIVLINNIAMLSKEIIQVITYSRANKYGYIKNPQNWMEIALIVIIYIILFYDTQSREIRSLFATAAIFLSYLELMLLHLSHPERNVHLIMLKTVTMNGAKFLMYHLILILAFAFSFHIYFREANPANQNSTIAFRDIPHAVFKTLLMSTGDYDLPNYNDSIYENYFGILNMIYTIFFIFLIPIVLMNLLNAIAVSDIGVIKKDAELVSTIALVHLIAHMEKIISDIVSLIDRYHVAKNGLLRKLLDYCVIHPTQTISNHREITCYLKESGMCRTLEGLKYPILSSTLYAIQEKLTAARSSEEKVDPVNII
ncbi:hypothetical protein V9T40_011289 [Parthenolecanium corni]|uniref:Ion transport domain-containing protein n=1 Tax=Parthenolecanium corni TaxID=536013 RepID=A0AAN9T926_9HEMI